MMRAEFPVIIPLGSNVSVHKDRRETPHVVACVEVREATQNNLKVIRRPITVPM